MELGLHNGRRNGLPPLTLDYSLLLIYFINRILVERLIQVSLDLEGSS